MADPRVSDYVFFVTQIGAAGTTQRQRSNDVLEGIVRTVATDFGLRAIRGDKVSRPSQVGTQIIKEMIGAATALRVVAVRHADAMTNPTAAERQVVFSVDLLTVLDEALGVCADEY